MEKVRKIKIPNTNKYCKTLKITNTSIYIYIYFIFEGEIKEKHLILELIIQLTFVTGLIFNLLLKVKSKIFFVLVLGNLG